MSAFTSKHKVWTLAVVWALVILMLFGFAACRGNKEMGNPKMSATVMLDIFSGVPNPSWPLSNGDASILVDMLDALERGQPCDLAEPLGYRGFEINITDSDNSSGRHFKVLGGQAKDLSTGLCYSDPDKKIEKLLLETSIAQVDEDTYTLVKTEVWSENQ